ncbi:Rhophilin, Rho GTPase binding protein, partial [Nowakowskiella sp. JEL0078]
MGVFYSYLENVPTADKLKPIDAATVVEALALPDLASMKEVIGSPWFMTLVPFAVHQAASIYTEKRDNFVKDETAKLQEATAILNNILSTMNLPGAIDAIEQPAGLPTTLLKRSEEVKNQGGARSLNDMMNTVAGLSANDFALLEEALQILDREAAEDTEMRNQFHERWTRTQSKDLTTNLRETAKTYREKLNKAKLSDQLVKTKVEKFFPYIEALCASKSELEASIPASTKMTTIASDPRVKGLRT